MKLHNMGSKNGQLIGTTQKSRPFCKKRSKFLSFEKPMASKVFLTITTWVGIFVLKYNNDELNKSLQNMLILSQFFRNVFSFFGHPATLPSCLLLMGSRANMQRV